MSPPVRSVRPTPRPAAPLTLAASLVALAAVSCGPGGPLGRDSGPPEGWRRLDLTRTEPAGVDHNLSGAEPAWEARIGYLGSEEVRDMRRVPKSQLEVFPFRRAAQIRVLEQRAGTRIAWPVELGRSPYVSFIPVGWRGDRCDCLYRFGLRDARGTLHELHRTEAAEVEPLSRGAVEVDLADFAGSRVELLLQVDALEGAGGQPTGSAIWGSPALYDRTPVEPRRPGTPQRPNVVLLGLDTVRPDHFGAFRPETAHGPSLTPAIDRLAEESDVWTSAFSTFNSTNPSFTSIFTGLYGKNHGVYDLQTPLPQAHETMAELFSQAGYSTLAVISASHLGDHNSGLGQGFDQVLLSEHTFAGELPVDYLMDFVAEREAPAEPFFAWIHLFDPHTPHTPPEPYATGFRPWRASGLAPVAAWIPFRRPDDRTFAQPVLGGHADLYAGEIAYMDRQVDRLVGYLESHDLLETTLVVLVGDHGENLGDHGIDFRHMGLWDTTTHVPMLIRWPSKDGSDASRRQGRRMDGLVQTIDLFPTVLGAAGIEAPQSDGLDLRQLTGTGSDSEKGSGPGSGQNGRRAVFSEHTGRDGASVRTPTHRYTHILGHNALVDGVALYSLRQDPDEETNLAGRGLEVEETLRGLLDRWLADRREAPETEPRQLGEEERKKLRALGYLD